MRHYRQISGPRTFTDTVTIQFEGSPKCGSAFDVEVEFRAWPDHWDASVGQGDAGEREIISIRPYEKTFDADLGRYRTERTYLTAPAWLLDHLKDCIDLNALDADFSEG